MILCCGESLIDMLPRRSEVGEDVFLPCAGGAIFNTAITLGRLGEEAGFFSGISTDSFGKKLASELESSGVDYAHCIRSPRPTTLAFVELVDGEARYNFYDENTAGRMIEPESLPDLPVPSAAHFGAISLIGEPCGSAYEHLATRLCRDAVISFDPNIRPGFVTDEEAYRNRLDRMLAIADIVKVSEDDLDWLARGEVAERFVARVLGGRTSILIVTRGADGVEVLQAESKMALGAPRAEVVDTVGAGDSFNGGLLAGLRREGLLSRDRIINPDKDRLTRAVEFAMRVAAVTVSRAGADPPFAHELGETAD